MPNESLVSVSPLWNKSSSIPISFITDVPEGSTRYALLSESSNLGAIKSTDDVTALLVISNLVAPPVSKSIVSVSNESLVSVSPLWKRSLSIPIVFITDVPAKSPRYVLSSLSKYRGAFTSTDAVTAVLEISNLDVPPVAKSI